MIKSEHLKNEQLLCSISGSANDILNEFRAILEALSKEKMLMLQVIMILEDFCDEQIKNNDNKTPDCFRANPDTINEFIKHILKEKKEND